MGLLEKFFGSKKEDDGKPKTDKSGRSYGKLDVSARFQLNRHSFTGTMSRFQVAKEIGTGKLYGIKFLDPEKYAYFNARFKGLNKPPEGEIGMKIKHPLIAETYEYGVTTQDQEYILMEYIKGPGLDAAIRRDDASLFPDRLKLVRQMAQTLQVVHDHNFIHRDVCPRNFICLSDFSSLKMIDFGLTLPNETPFLQPGNRTGTPQYMAPEIVRRRVTSPKLDIFSFGVTAYKLLTFEHPWSSTDQTGKAALIHDTQQPTSILEHRPKLDKRLADAIHKCLLPNPDDRMPSCKSFLNAIRSLTSDQE